MSIEKRLERVEAILDARGLDWDHPRVEEDHFADANKMVAEEPPKKWRRLTDEFVQPGDWANAKVNRQDVDPPDGGWIPADPCYFGRRACTLSMYFARPVAEEPAKEASLDGLPDIRTFAQPNLRWRILEPGELIKQGDWSCRKSLPSCNDPVKGNGWIMTGAWGLLVGEDDVCVYARPVFEEPAKEPPKKWRILVVGEEVQEGDRVKAKASPPSDPPNGLGWCRADPSVGTSVFEDDPCVFARPVADEPAKEQAEEPPKKWRILGPGEVVCSGDWVNAKSNLPHGLGWKLQTFSTGQTVSKHDECVFARPVAEEPAKEPEHPVVPMPDPGEGYRILGKNPPEELTPEIDDWWEYDEQRWRGVFPLDLTAQHPRIWYRRKIGFPARGAEPEYREPVLPADVGKECEFSDDSISWEGDDLIGWRANLNTFNWEGARDSYRYARIKKDA